MAAAPDLHALLEASGLADKATRVDEHMARLQWGSAFVLVAVSGTAVVAIAPLFSAVPSTNTAGFFRKLLEHNGHMGGVASFAIQPDGWIVLHAARPLKGLDGPEFATMIAAVGRFADQFDDELIKEFYASQREATNQTQPEPELPQTD